MKFKSIFLISLILCVFLTFSTVNAMDLDCDANSNLDLSQSESGTLSSENLNNVSESINDNNSNDVVPGIELLNLDDDVKSVSGDLKDNISEEAAGQVLKSDDDSVSNLSSSVSSNGGALQGNYIVNGSTFADIQKAIDNAKNGDTITLKGISFLGNGTEIEINKSLNIIGSDDGKTILNACNLSGIFNVNGSNLNISNCNFINSNDIAIEVFSDNFTMINCNFKDNYGRFSSHFRMITSTNNLYVENCSFINGFVEKSTNIAAQAENSVFRDCIFAGNIVRGNSSGYGGAMQIGGKGNETNIGYIYNCIFLNNAIDNTNDLGHGGALCFRPGIIVSNTTFINNSCSGVGGATTLHADGELYDCIFINNSAEVYGGAITTGLEGDDISVNMTRCYFEGNTAPLAGAIQIKGNDVRIRNSTFKNNRALESDGGAIFIQGENTQIINSNFEDNFASNIGGAIHIQGGNVTVFSSIFNNNVADYGAAIYIVGENATVSKSIFKNHTVKNGTVFINGEKAYINASDFNENHGVYGAAVFIEGSKANMRASNFTNNNVSKNGGAVYIVGSNSKLTDSNFFYNNAIPNQSDIDSGLGGAVYIKGDNNLFRNSNFTYNTARNGSAIYTDGKNVTLNKTSFDKNQAWSYRLDLDAIPSISYFNQSDIIINISYKGGNNIANAIYNTASIEDISFYNVSYISSKGPKETGLDVVHPVLGVENSLDGSLLYQDDREDNQLIDLLVADGDEVLFNKTFTTGIFGNVSFDLNSYLVDAINPGNYTVFANHIEDPYYKQISSENSFEIIPLVDLAVEISTDNSSYDFSEIITYMIEVVNNGPNNASEVILNEFLPKELIIVSNESSKGEFDSSDYSWNIGDLASGENQTLIVQAIANATGLLDYPIEVSSLEEDTNKSNNIANKTVYIRHTDLAVDIVASDNYPEFGEDIDLTVRVSNLGVDDAMDVVLFLSDLDDLGFIINDCSDSSFDLKDFIWNIGELKIGDTSVLTLNLKINKSNSNLTVSANVETSTFEDDLANNYDEETIEIPPICDLTIEISPDVDVVNFTDDALINWSIIVSNADLDDACDVIVFLNDSNLNIVDVSDSSYNLEDNTWFIGDLASGESVVLLVSTKPLVSNSNMTVSSEVKTSTGELNYTNNYDEASVEVLPVCDLAIEISPDADEVNFTEDSIVNWTIIVTNGGKDDAKDVIVSVDNLKELGLDVLNSSDSDNFDAESYLWKIGDMAGGENRTLLVSTIPNISNNDIVVSVKVNTSTMESNLDNNLDNGSLLVLPLCDLAITIIQDKDVINLTSLTNIDLENFDIDEYLNSDIDIVKWLITVSNNGPDNASSVVAHDILSSDLELISYEISRGELKNNLNQIVSNESEEDDEDSYLLSSADESNNSLAEDLSDEDSNSEQSSNLELNWEIGNLASGESATLLLTTRVLNTGTINHEVEVSTDVYESDYSNNNDSANITVFEDEVDDEENTGGDEEDPGDDEAGTDGNKDDNDDEIYIIKDKSETNQDTVDNRSKNSNGLNNTPKNNGKTVKAIEMKNTGNQLIVLVLSILGLLPIQFRKKF